MEKLGIIHRKFENYDTPTCAACMYAKSTCKPWCGRSIKTPYKPRQVTKPGKIFSVYHLVSPTPGLVAYMNVILTTKINKYATVFLYNFSRYSYMHLQQTASAEDTLEGKHAFERMAASYGIIIKKYHADNGIFRANSWAQDCQ